MEWRSVDDFSACNCLFLDVSQNSKCQAYLVSIEKDSKILWDNEEVPLTFAPGEGSDALNKTIEHGGSYPVDVVIVQRGDGDPLFLGTPGRDWPHFDSVGDIFSETGDYIINVRVSADDCPSILAKVKFHWGGNSFDCGIDVIATQTLDESRSIVSITTTARITTQSQSRPLI